MVRKIIVEGIALLFIGLFVYVAVSKILDYETFAGEVGSSPLLKSFGFEKAWGIWIAWIIPGVQIFIAGLLLFGYRIAGLFYTIVFIGLLTLYILYVLLIAAYVPCSCSGVLNSMTWTQHLYFNLVCLAVALLGIKFSVNGNEEKRELNLFRSLKDILLVHVK